METGFAFEMIKMVSALAAVLGVMGLLYYAARKTVWKGWLPGDQGVLIRVLGQRSLGAKKSVTVLEVDGQRLVLGLTADSIRVLARTGDPLPCAVSTRESEPETCAFPDIMAVLDKGNGGVGNG